MWTAREEQPTLKDLKGFIRPSICEDRTAETRTATIPQRPILTGWKKLICISDKSPTLVIFCVPKVRVSSDFSLGHNFILAYD
jgi:hypothetical protein